MKAVVFSDSDTTPIRAGKTLNLNPVNISEYIFRSVNRIQEGNFAFVTLVIEIVVHNKTFRLGKKKTV